MEAIIVIALVMIVIGLLIVPGPAPKQIVRRESSIMNDLRMQFAQNGWVNADCSY